MSASQLRQELAELRKNVDPGQQAPALDQMVLVGHSMGGLVSKLQSVDSGHDFWKINSDQPFQNLQADPEIYNGLAQAYFFRPNASVSRVITIGTPHRGSRYANSLTRWLGRKMIDAPMRIMKGRRQLLAQNKGYFRPHSAFDIHTSIDSLAPDSPLLPVLLTAKPGPWVKYHNIIGRQPDSWLTKLMDEEGDGVVSLDSARLDNMPQLASQITVPSDHVAVHRHPQSVLEVRRVLLEQLAELDNLPYGLGPGVQVAQRLPHTAVVPPKIEQHVEQRMEPQVRASLALPTTPNVPTPNVPTPNVTAPHTASPHAQPAMYQQATGVAPPPVRQ